MAKRIGKTERRVRRIMLMMQAGEWMTGLSARALEQEWTLSPHTVSHLACEASRRVRHLRCSDDEQIDHCLATLHRVRVLALKEGKYRDAVEAVPAILGLVGAHAEQLELGGASERPVIVVQEAAPPERPAAAH